MSTLQTYNLKHPDASGNQITFTSGGLVGVGTSAPGTGTSSYYDDLVVKNDTAGTGAGITIQSNSTNGFSGLDLRTAGGTEIAKIAASAATSKLSIDAGGSTAITIDSSQQVGIGNASPTAKLQVESTSDQLKLTYPSVASYIHEVDSSGNYAIAKDSIEALRIDSSGRLLLGGSSSAKDYKLVVRNNAGTDGFEGGIFLQRATTPPASATGGHGLGTIVFGAAPTGDENEAAQIVAKSDGTWGVNDWPSRLEFYTTPDGSNVMMERMRITSAGRLGLGLGNISPAAKLDVNGNQTSNVVAMAALDVDCSAGNYFTKTINGNSTFTFSNVPSSRSFSFVLELTHTSGTVTWPSSVKFPGDTAPTLTAGKTHLFVFETNDGGTRFRGAALVDYVN